jgi:hypothetical protein
MLPLWTKTVTLSEIALPLPPPSPATCPEAHPGDGRTGPWRLKGSERRLAVIKHSDDQASTPFDLPEVNAQAISISIPAMRFIRPNNTEWRISSAEAWKGFGSRSAWLEDPLSKPFV